MLITAPCRIMLSQVQSWHKTVTCNHLQQIGYCIHCNQFMRLIQCKTCIIPCSILDSSAKVGLRILWQKRPQYRCDDQVAPPHHVFLQSSVTTQWLLDRIPAGCHQDDFISCKSALDTSLSTKYYTRESDEESWYLYIIASLGSTNTFACPWVQNVLLAMQNHHGWYPVG